MVGVWIAYSDSSSLLTFDIEIIIHWSSGLTVTITGQVVLTITMQKQSEIVKNWIQGYNFKFIKCRVYSECNDNTEFLLLHESMPGTQSHFGQVNILFWWEPPIFRPWLQVMIFKLISFHSDFITL